MDHNLSAVHHYQAELAHCRVAGMSRYLNDRLIWDTEGLELVSATAEFPTVPPPSATIAAEDWALNAVLEDELESFKIIS